MQRRYVAIGNVRGQCPHKHKSVRTALKCALKDGRGLSGTQYSDRLVKAYEDGRVVELNADEEATLHDLQRRNFEGESL